MYSVPMGFLWFSFTLIEIKRSMGACQCFSVAWLNICSIYLNILNILKVSASQLLPCLTLFNCENFFPLWLIVLSNCYKTSQVPLSCESGPFLSGCFTEPAKYLHGGGRDVISAVKVESSVMIKVGKEDYPKLCGIHFLFKNVWTWLITTHTGISLVIPCGYTLVIYYCIYCKTLQVLFRPRHSMPLSISVTVSVPRTVDTVDTECQTCTSQV